MGCIDDLVHDEAAQGCPPSLLYELRLIRCSLTASAVQSPFDELAVEDLLVEERSQTMDMLPRLKTAIEAVLEHVESGEYTKALASEPLRIVFGDAASADLGDGPSDCFSFLKLRVAAFLGDQCSDSYEAVEELQARSILALAVGVAALLNFTQANKTGPQEHCQAFPLAEWYGKEVGSEWEAWANRQLMVDGCDFLGKFSLPQYLMLAKLLLVAPTDSIKTISGHWEPVTKTWWACRALLAHQQVLAERSASLLELLQMYSERNVGSLGTRERVLEFGWTENLYPGEAGVIAGTVQLEAGLVQYAFSHADKARQHLEQAKQVCGLHLSVTGALGFRTIHQVDPKAQMVLVAESSTVESDPHSGAEPQDANSFLASQKQKEEQSEILLAPRVQNQVKDAGIRTGADTEGSTQHVLRPIEQVLVLSECLHILKNNPDDELKSWEMAPFIEAVDAQPLSPHMVQAWCDLLRIQWERQRHRTQERSLLMMERLVEEVRNGSTKVARRMCYAFSVSFPTLSALLKDYAEMMVACGLVGEALRLFEELELWNSLIDCYSLLGKKAAASDLIQERLKVQPNDPRLWCSLGDVTLDEECYVKAWEVSDHHFARAQRSLGKAAYNRGEYKKSMDHWKTALALNPLFPDGWFALGSAALKAKDPDMAVQAFTRAVQLDPDKGESWNNIAAINMQRKKFKESFKAFEQALKFKRGSWHLWENFAQVSLEVGEFGRAAQAVFHVLTLSQGKRVDLISLTKLVEEVEARNRSEQQDSTSPPDGDNIDGDSSEGQTYKNSKLLLQNVGKLLTKVVSSGNGGPEAYGLLARWHRVKGDLTMSAEALLKQTRAYQGNHWQQSKELFQKFATASLDLCQVYLELAVDGSGTRELSAARMHLNNTLKQAERFQACDEYLALQRCRESVENRLQELRASS